MQPLLRISASAVDNYLRMRNEGVDYENPLEIYTQEKYIAEIKAGWQPTPAKTFGTAFGAIITEPEKYKQKSDPFLTCVPANERVGKEEIVDVGSKTFYRKFTHLENGVWQFHDFDETQVELGIKLMSEYRPYSSWEVKREIKIGNTTLVCKCDGLMPTFLIDNKTTKRFDYATYEDSFQWRAYLLAFPGTEFFRYHVFVFYAENVSGYRKFKELRTLEFFRYDEIENEVKEIVTEMSAFIYANNLEIHFQPYEKR